MKGNKGITLIALIVTIIVLIILAGVAIAMIAGDNGIINNASKAKIDTQIATVDEKVKMARTSMATNIISRSNQASSDDKGYVATRVSAFETLVKELRRELGINEEPIQDTTLRKDNFTVSYYAPEGDTGLLANNAEVDEKDREVYVIITYTDNSLRSSLPKKSEITGNTYTSAGVKFNVEGAYNPNTTVLAYVIKVTDYGCELCVPTLASTASTVTNAIKDADVMKSSIVKDTYAKTTYNDAETPSTTPSTTP